MNLTNVVLPSLIAPELVMVSPMTSFTGYITYLQFVAGSQKGNVNQGDLLNGVFALGDAQKNVNYTSSVVTRTAKTAASGATSLTLDWTPVLAGTTLVTMSGTATGTGDGSETDFTIPANVGVTKVTVDGVETDDYSISGTTLTFTTAPANGKAVAIDWKLFIVDVATAQDEAENTRTLYAVKGATSIGKVLNTATGAYVLTFYAANGTKIDTTSASNIANVGDVTLGSVRADQTYPPKGNGGSGLATASVTGTLTLDSGAVPASTDYVLEYTYNNEYVPQNDLPLINARMNGIALQAKARRIAVYFSQIAAFQAHTDYGFDLQDQLASKAAGELSYEIDTEIVNFLYEMATKNEDSWGFPVWNRTQPVGVNYKLSA